MKREIPKHSNSLDRTIALENENKRLEEENKKLKEDIADMDKALMQYINAVSEFQEKIKKMNEENEQLKLHIEAKDKAYMSLLTDYNYLQARIKRMEKGYLKFHDDLKKLDDELDDVIMNR